MRLWTLLAILSLACSLRAEEKSRPDPFHCPGGRWPWEGEGPFVNIPASISAAPGGIVGAALALALVPADLVESGLSKDKGRQDEPLPRFAHVGVCAGVYLGKGLSYPIGAPFWLLKKAFWDWPKRWFSPDKAGQEGTSGAAPVSYWHRRAIFDNT